MGCFRESYEGTAPDNSRMQSYEGTSPDNSRMHVYDQELQSRATELKLDSDTVKCLAEQHKFHNSWASMYRALLLEVDENGGDNVNISVEETSRVQPTAGTEIAALLYKDNSRASGTRHVYTFSRNGPASECNKSRFVPIYSSTLDICNIRCFTSMVKLDGLPETISWGEQVEHSPRKETPLTFPTTADNDYCANPPFSSRPLLPKNGHAPVLRGRKTWLFPTFSTSYQNNACLQRTP